jgi:hypothetical protein
LFGVGVSAFHRSLWPEILRRYEAGEEMKVIAEDLGIDTKTVYNVARRAGLPNRHVFDQKRTDRILTAYESGTPVGEIARAEGVHRSFVRNVARRAGLPARKDWARRYPLDESAFDNPTRVGWWLVGLLAADGCVRTGNLISLTQRERDADVLRAFLRYVGCPNRPLTELKLSPEAAKRAWPRSPACEARVWSRHMKEVLASHGVTASKTTSLTFSNEAARQTAVWLGLLDGDGWVSRVAQHGRIIAFYGAPPAMTQCSEFWTAQLGLKGAACLKVHKHSGGLKCVRLQGANAARAAAILLDSSPISLQRKRRSLEAIAATEVGGGQSTPPRMRTSEKSN